MADETELGVEREKTKRHMMTLGVGGLIGLIVIILFFNSIGNRQGSVDVDVTSLKFKVSLDKPIGEQVQQPTSTLSTKDGELKFNTGTISDSVIKNVEAQGQTIDPTRFSGKNLISPEAGFVLSSQSPSKWTVAYDKAGLRDPSTPITRITGDGLGNLFITRGPDTDHAGIRASVEVTVNEMRQRGMINADPDIRYVEANQTAFLTFTNTDTGGQSYMKVVIYNDTVYVASANYNAVLTDQSTKNDLINMVASFSPIAK